MNLAEFLNTNTGKFPQKPAIGFKKGDKWAEINWQQFRDIVFKTANALQNSGIKEGDRVAIFSENTAEWICFDLGVLSLGAVTVPIYSTNNREQAEYILAESQSKIILTGNQEQYDFAYEISEKSPFLERILVSKKSVWIKKDRTDYFEDFISKAAPKFDIVQKSDDDLATLIYTSGTTGTPKGVMLSHGNFTKCFKSHFEFFQFKNFENEHSLAFLPLTHVFERSWSLLCLFGGAKVTFLENPKLIAHALQEVKPTMMCAVPRFYQKIYAGILDTVNSGSGTKKKIFGWAMQVGKARAQKVRKGEAVPALLKAKFNLAEALVFNKIKAKIGGQLWFMPCGGASVSPEVTEFFDAMGLHITVGYGLTESTATLTCFPLKNYKYGTAGVPLGDAQLKIGENDEVLAKGSAIMMGYYQKPDETAKVFTEDGWFRTGDAGKIDADGNLTITDRIKDLMKTSNGKYVAPQPIENLLSNNNYIQQVMLVAEGRPFVSALIVPNFEFLKDEMSQMNLPFTDWETAVALPEIKSLYQSKLDEYQEELPGFEKVKKFTLMSSEFEISTGEITPTLKIKRNIVQEKYKDLIEKMYQS